MATDSEFMRKVVNLLESTSTDRADPSKVEFNGYALFADGTEVGDGDTLEALLAAYKNGDNELVAIDDGSLGDESSWFIIDNATNERYEANSLNAARKLIAKLAKKFSA